MIVIGTIWICTFLLPVPSALRFVDDGLLGIVFLLEVMACFIMVTAGSICVHSHGESELCGPGGEGGGIAMAVLGLVLLSSLVCIARRFPIVH
jgi:hypothetical protein